MLLGYTTATQNIDDKTDKPFRRYTEIDDSDGKIGKDLLARSKCLCSLYTGQKLLDCARHCNDSYLPEDRRKRNAIAFPRPRHLRARTRCGCQYTQNKMIIANVFVQKKAY